MLHTYSPYITRSLHSIPRASLRVKTGYIEIWRNTSYEETPLEMLFVIPIYFLGMFAANLIEFQNILKETYQYVEDVKKPPEITPVELEFGNKAYLNGKRCTMALGSDRVIRLNYANVSTDIIQASNVVILMRVRK